MCTACTTVTPTCMGSSVNVGGTGGGNGTMFVITGNTPAATAFPDAWGDPIFSVLPNLVARLRYNIAATLFDLVQELSPVEELRTRPAILCRAGELTVSSRARIEMTDRKLTARRVTTLRAAFKPPRICLFAVRRSWI